MGKMISVTFEVDTKIYPMEAIYSAAYTFIDRAYIYLSGNPKGIIRVNFRPKNGAYNFEDIRGEFMNELLSCSLRNQISEKNHKIREYIVGAALLGASGEIPHLDEIENVNANKDWEDDDSEECDCEDGDYHYDEETDAFKAEGNSWEDDPFGISIPWEDKYPTTDTKANESVSVQDLGGTKEVEKSEGEPKQPDLVPGDDGIIDVSDEELAKYAKPWDKQ